MKVGASKAKGADAGPSWVSAAAYPGSALGIEVEACVFDIQAWIGLVYLNGRG